jgi:hypothetical protein
MKSPTMSRKKFLYIFSGFALVILLLSYKTILIAAGNFLAPQGVGTADVVILENAEVIREKELKICIDMVSSRRVNRLVIVYQNSGNERIFDRPPNYSLLIKRRLEGLGLNKDQILVIEVPEEHPITLTEAKIVLCGLSNSGVRSAVLLAEGFHMRRSYWSYKRVGQSLGIRIIPSPYFMKYRNDNWWTEIKGVSDFGYESLKYVYYLLRGYVPVKSILTI